MATSSPSACKRRWASKGEDVPRPLDAGNPGGDAAGERTSEVADSDAVVPTPGKGVTLQEAARIMLEAAGEAQRTEASLRSRCASLEAELLAVQQQGSKRERALEELRAEHEKLQLRYENLGAVVAKQQRVIKEHEVRLRAFSAKALKSSKRVSSGTKRKRISAPSSQSSPEKPGPASLPAPEMPTAGEETRQRSLKAPRLAIRPFRGARDPNTAGEASTVLSSDKSPASSHLSSKVGAELPQMKSPPHSADKLGGESKDHAATNHLATASRTGAAATSVSNPADKTIEASNPRRLRRISPQLENIPGLRVWEAPPKKAKTFDGDMPKAELPPPPPPPPPTGGFTRSRSSRELVAVDGQQAQVRAEGRTAILAQKVQQGLPCRCVVRGRDQRLALQGFDCEQCRKFHEATGTGGGAAAMRAGWQNGPKASRHRFEHAPTSTPPGFWDLSFPVHGEPANTEALPLCN